MIATPSFLLVLLVCPSVAVGVLPFGLGNLTKMKVDVVDESFTPRAREMVTSLMRSPHVVAVNWSPSREISLRKMDKGKIEAIVVVRPEGEQPVILVDGSHILQARDISSYLMRLVLGDPMEGLPLHPHLRYVSGDGNMHYYMCTILAILIAIIGCFLAVVSVVDERQKKMLEHLRSIGMKAGEYVLTKVVFFIAVALLELGVGLVIARVVYDFSCAGSLVTYFALGACFLLCMVNLGIFIASVSDSQVRAIFIMVFSFFVLILLSTMFAPLDNMSEGWAATRFVNPFFWMADGSWKVLLKNVGAAELWPNYVMLLLWGSLLMLLNIRNLTYRLTP